jgi:NADPH2:quinone reductase
VIPGAWRIVVRRHGGPEVLEREDFDPGAPGPGTALVRITAVGLNFIDTYQRSGLYPLTLPAGLGSEFAGVVEAIGDGVTSVRPGQRVAGALRSPGAYATRIVADAAALFPLPDSISDEVAAAVTIKGLTAWALLEPCAKLRAGQSVLIHSAAGGVGSILVPWAKSLGAFVIAHAGSETKAERARLAGADHALHCDFDVLAARVREITGGHGVDVVLDGVGAASWAASLASTARRGLIASYGNASGPVPPIAPLELARAGSLFLTRPAMFDYIETAEERSRGANRLFTLIGDGTLPIEIGQRFALEDAAEAHRALESRHTVGSTILIP